MKKIYIIDYAMGNLRSVQKAVNFLGFSASITENETDLKKADLLIIPGVGSFKKAMHNLRDKKLIEPILAYHQKGKPILGICLGLQILMTEGTEEGKCPGLNIIKGSSLKLKAKKIPHIGWNNLEITNNNSTLLKGIKNNAFFYFVHSYYGNPQDQKAICATSNYGRNFCAAIEYQNIFATQFHPEKSGKEGLKILKNFCSL